MKRAWWKYCIVGLTMVALGSCSTQSNKWANVQYHNITTHYNIWWNGNESLKEGIELLNKNGQDDYTQILSIYKMGTKESAMAIYPQMDRAIEKGIKGIKKHSIIVSGKEYVDYVKECYLLTAYATFYKHDFVSTSNTCSLIMNQYAGTRAADEATILSARCMTMDKQYAMAESQLAEMIESLERGGVAKSQQANLYMAMAECLIPQEKYGKAVKYLKLALKQVSKNATEARLNFIMAQIYQKVGKRTVATKYYEEVLKCHPDYVMDFNARINIASCADFATSDLAKLERGLDKMLNDKKNEEYKDQIYYAKGEMYMGMKDAKKACDNFKSSVAVAKTNLSQKAKSAIRLGEILYELYENYDLSQIYYDTAMQVIKPDYPHYFDIKERYDVLTSLVSYTRVIDRNDSLIRVADMEPTEQLAYIEKKIEDLKKAEEEAKRQALIAQFEANTQAQLNTLKGNWYFYNANTVQKGKNQFKETWGMRMLEDYWFLSNKGSLGMGSMVTGLTMDEEETTDEVKDSVATIDSTKLEVDKSDPTDPHNVAYYLVDLPKDEDDRDSMNLQTADCLLNAGYMYYEGIRNVPKSMECYLRMANEFTDYEGIVRAFYQLYVLYDQQGNTPQANYYKDMVLMGFPDSDFANLIRDSEYYKELMKRDQRIQVDYEELYNLYRRRRYGDVIVLVDESLNNYKESLMLPKFRYWKGLAFARLDNKDSAIHVFEGLVKDNPATDSIVPLAQMQLDMLRADVAMADETEISEAEEQRSKHQEGSQIAPKDQSASGEEEELLPPEARLYRYRENMQHYVLIVVDDKKIRATDMQIKVANFNMEYYANAGLKVNVFMFTDTTQMITIHRFDNAESAMNYWNHLQRPEGPLKNYDSKNYTAIPMSIQNYSTFYNKKDMESYMLFFDRYYMKK